MTIAFGQLFNNIQIKRKDSSGSVIQSIRVPLAYAPKEKFLTRLDQQPDLDSREFAITLPRMSFEISTIEYDASRKLNRLQKFKKVKTGAEGKTLDFNYMPVPYNISYTLNVFTATAEGGLQIIEQILPYFQPDYTVTVNAIPGLDIKRDVPIILNGVNYEDSYSGDYTTRRAVIYTLTFTAKTYLFGPAQTQGVVKKVQADLYSDTDRNNKAREERIIIEPNPTSADADDDFGFTTTIESYTDGKKYNTTTDSDE
tara:strand:+ start:85 stop:852 length:768 start_codon:yes stop_codon:yes gene_type:complete